MIVRNPPRMVMQQQHESPTALKYIVHPWKQPKPVWMWSVQTALGGPEVGPVDLQRSLPTSTVVRFCEYGSSKPVLLKHSERCSCYYQELVPHFMWYFKNEKWSHALLTHELWQPSLSQLPVSNPAQDPAHTWGYSYLQIHKQSSTSTSTFICLKAYKKYTLSFILDKCL